MVMKWMEFECETPLLAEAPETRQHFFLFPDFLFLPVVNRLQHYVPTRAKAHLLAEPINVCQYFFKDFLETFSEPRISNEIFRFVCFKMEGGALRRRRHVRRFPQAGGAHPSIFTESNVVRFV
jgi:hypothetical protein